MTKRMPAVVFQYGTEFIGFLAGLPYPRQVDFDATKEQESRHEKNPDANVREKQ